MILSSTASGIPRGQFTIPNEEIEEEGRKKEKYILEVNRKKSIERKTLAYSRMTKVFFAKYLVEKLKRAAAI